MAERTTEDPKGKTEAAAPEGEAATNAPEGADAGTETGPEKTDEQLWTELEAAEAKTEAVDAEPGPETPADSETDAAGGTPPASEPPKTEDKPKGKDGAAADDKAAASDADDIWTNAPPELKAAHEAALNNQREGHRRNIKGYENTINDLRGRVEKSPEGGGVADAEKTKLSLKSPGWQEFEKDYPDVAEPVTQIVESIIADNAKIRKELSAVSMDHRHEALKAEERKLTEAHVDWEDVITTVHFKDWLGEQPAFIHEMAIRNSDAIRDAEEAGHLLNLYKRTVSAGGGSGQPAPSPDPGGDQPKPAADPKHDAKRQAQKESAASPASGGGPSASSHTGPPDTEDPQKIWDYFEQKDRKEQAA